MVPPVATKIVPLGLASNHRGDRSAAVLAVLQVLEVALAVYLRVENEAARINSDAWRLNASKTRNIRGKHFLEMCMEELSFHVNLAYAENKRRYSSESVYSTNVDLNG